MSRGRIPYQSTISHVTISITCIHANNPINSVLVPTTTMKGMIRRNVNKIETANRNGWNENSVTYETFLSNRYAFHSPNINFILRSFYFYFTESSYICTIIGKIYKYINIFPILLKNSLNSLSLSLFLFLSIIK